MKSEGFKHLNQSCPSVLPELLNTVAAADKSSTTSSGQSSKKRSVSSVLGCDTSTTNARQCKALGNGTSVWLCVFVKALDNTSDDSSRSGNDDSSSGDDDSSSGDDDSSSVK
ncbi:hypothetical protein DY000_02035653 [Brassica cretica]|uniref:Uncharacterized protein n=1 Tax=Brassica cretica TaxID=69181 RepID=A0ABQ7DW71_BRACR|nr:hypothetical protein DY000_02035653 [Brassica cretica]